MRATFISRAASDEVGLAGFGRLLDVADVPLVTCVLAYTSFSESMKAAVCGEAGAPTLLRLLEFCDRSASSETFGILRNILNHPHSAQATAVQELFNHGIVAWLEKHLRHFILTASVAAAATPLLGVCHSLLATPDGREAMRPLCNHFTTALSSLSRSPASGCIFEAAAIACKCLIYCASDVGTFHSTVAITMARMQPGSAAAIAFLARSRPPRVSVADARHFAHALMATFFPPW